MPDDLHPDAVDFHIVSERVAMQLTGHRALSVFDRYDVVSEAGLTDAVKKLSRGGNGA